MKRKSITFILAAALAFGMIGIPSADAARAESRGDGP